MCTQVKVIDKHASAVTKDDRNVQCEHENDFTFLKYAFYAGHFTTCAVNCPMYVLCNMDKVMCCFDSSTTI